MTLAQSSRLYCLVVDFQSIHSGRSSQVMQIPQCHLSHLCIFNVEKLICITKYDL